MQQLLFHEPWWLAAASNGDYQETTSKNGTEIVGRLPYVVRRRGPFNVVRMPSFTHILGPIVDAGTGKLETRLRRRSAIVRSLIDQLPPNSFFHQHLDTSVDDGLASVDGLAFQERRFAVSTQYTFEVDCRKDLSVVWAEMSQKTRQPIRRAEERYSVKTVEIPDNFVNFYQANTKAAGQNNRIDFRNFTALYTECRSRGCATLLGAFDHDGTPVAMAYLVWGHGTMYYLLSTRSTSADYGAISLLLWTAIKEAHGLGTVLDLDGVYSVGTARFLSSFGGQIKTRLVVRRSRGIYSAIQNLKRVCSRDESYYFT
ncbi:GNAT family N-acetyltransferase [Bradyrhizobium genosp. A]|uniref:GNAT family N-acetyltransferase n=1 Tax=Bradyrhizobium genosp. A TaxID=83626 RepID=UPI003CF0C593